MHFNTQCGNIITAVKHPGVAQIGSALEWGSRGRWFDSSHSDQGKSLETFVSGLSLFYKAFFTEFSREYIHMNDNLQIKPIADIYTDFPDKFGIPRQSGRASDLTGTIVFRNDYRYDEALRGLEGFSHIWIIFGFSQHFDKSWHPTVRPPRLGGNERVGVFASRSPFRPNPLGLSCVKLDEIRKTENDGTVLIVSGVDMLSGTPIYDIKPYVAYADAHTEAEGSFAAEHSTDRLSIRFAEGTLEKIPEQKRPALIQCLQDDPRPSYQEDPERIYRMRYAEQDIGFVVEGKILTVTEVEGTGRKTTHNSTK